jgi:hypothetical protein
VGSTNPFEDDDNASICIEETATSSTINGTQAKKPTKAPRKKRRAPPPPTNVSIKVCFFPFQTSEFSILSQHEKGLKDLLSFSLIFFSFRHFSNPVPNDRSKHILYGAWKNEKKKKQGLLQ